MCVLSSTAGTQTQNQQSHAPVSAAVFSSNGHTAVEPALCGDNVAELPMRQTVCAAEYS